MSGIPLVMWTDGDPSLNQENTSRLNVNANANAEKGALTNESSFTKITSLGNLQIIGHIALPNNQDCYFSINPNYVVDNYKCEIGILDASNTYRPILRDNLSIANAGFGFDLAHLIQGTFKVGYNGDIIVYWVNGLNVDRFLNLSNLQVTVDSSLRISNVNQVKLLNSFPVTELINLDITSITGGGSLTSGAYYVILQYTDATYNPTRTGQVSNPISITKNNTSTYSNSYDGVAVSTTTGSQINCSILASNLDTSFAYVRVCIISKVNQSLAGHEYAFYPVPKTGNLTFSIENLSDKTSIDPQALLVNLANYTSSLTLTQLDDVLYKGNLKDLTNKYDLQSYVNNIKINYTTKKLDLSSTAYIDSNYRSENQIFYDKSFMWDEVYALYFQAVIEDGNEIYETKAFNIPGRPAALINLGGSDYFESQTINGLSAITNYYGGVNGNTNDWTPLGQINAVNTNAKIFHGIDTADNLAATTNMGYWENLNEKYPDGWKILSKTDSVIEDLSNTPVRHHKFPEPYRKDIKIGLPNLHTNVGGGNYSEVNVLGISFSLLNIFPDDIKSKIKKIKIYYAKRDINNRTILGQSMSLPGGGVHSPTEDKYGAANQASVVNVAGNIQWINIFRESADKGHSLLFGGPGAASYSVTPLSYNIQYGYNGLYNINNSLYPFNTTHPWNSGDLYTTGIPAKGYNRFKPFDLLSQSVNVAQASYIKNLYRVKSKYTRPWATGSCDASPTPSSFAEGSFLNTSLDYYGIDRNTRKGLLVNSIRKIKNINYIPANLQPNTFISSNPYGFTEMNPFSYGGEEYILTENYLSLFSYDNISGTYEAGQDFCTLDLSSDALEVGSYTNAFASPYVSNLCAFKSDLFLNSQNLILCDVGNSFDFAETTFSTLGGDTFTNYYGERSTVDFGGLFDNAGKDRKYFQMRVVHYYICQSTSNINYRYNGDTPDKSYYPNYPIDVYLQLPNTDDNWYGYNIDYSSQNDLLQPVINLFQQDALVSEFPNRVIRSATNNPEALTDNFRVFEAGNAIDVGKATGAIANLTTQNSKLLVQTQNSTYYTLGREIISTANAESFVGAGNIFGILPKPIVTSNDAYGGVQGRFTTIVNEYGCFIVDTVSGTILLYNGEQLNDISKQGKEYFFYDELRFKFNKEIDALTYTLIPNWSPVAGYQKASIVKHNGNVYQAAKVTATIDIPGTSSKWVKYDYSFKNMDSLIDTQSIGVAAEFDYKYNRYILSKKDYEIPLTFNYYGLFNAENLTYWTENPTKVIQYNGSFYTTTTDVSDVLLYYYFGTPLYGTKINFDDYFIPKKFTIGYYPELKGWVSFYTYQPDFVSNNSVRVISNKNGDLYAHNSNESYGIYYDFKEYTPFISEPVFNLPKETKRLASVQVKTKGLTNGNIDYLQQFDECFTYDSYQISKTIDLVNTKTTRNVEGYWNINDFRDDTKDNGAALFDNAYIIREPNSANIDNNKHWSKRKKLVDYWFIMRLIYNNRTYKALDSGLLLQFIAPDQMLNVSPGPTPFSPAIGDIYKMVDTTSLLEYIFVVTAIGMTTTVEFIGTNLVPYNNRTFNNVAKLQNLQLNLLNTNALTYKNHR